MSQDIHMLLGEINGKLTMVIDNQARADLKIDALSTRLSNVETKAAKNGMITGAIAAIGVGLIKEKLGI